MGSRFLDQSRISGHDDRPEDLDRLAELGISALRYPLLWERVAPDDPDTCDWRWTDERFARLKALRIRPIAGLVHHGSGPHYTDLMADSFAPGLARFARAAAERYAWIQDWTPVNEPVTTARFSALYGHWYPHLRDERSFWIALLNQIDGVRLAMREIRRVNPAARLIQTEDLGRSWATVPLRHQAGFDNVRRWMSWDLLCGRVVPEHPLWNRLMQHGLGDRLRAIADDPCPPDIIGVNHYLTSDRFLDHRLRRYPPHAAGGNNEQRYADVEAIRVLEPPPPGLRGVLQEAWERYRIPVAVTEVHNGCTREEQMRWMADAWRIAIDLRSGGVDLRAVTSWALLGSHNWDTLLTASGRYEPGAFDVGGDAPRATAVAGMLTALRSGEPYHPVVGGTGWWRRPARLLHSAVQRPAPMQDRPAAPGWNGDTRPPLLICGASGTLGQALARACRHRDIAHVLTARDALDVTDAHSIRVALDRHAPWAVINATGWVRVDDAEHHAEACHRANADGAALVARICDDAGIPSVTFSSDLVFDGKKGAPYVESDPTRPLNVYGGSKAAAERAIAALSGAHLVIRTAAFFSPHDVHNFAVHAVRALDSGSPFPASADQVMTPTYVPHLCDVTLDLLIDGAAGIWHLTNGVAVSWAEFARLIAARCGLDPKLVIDADPGTQPAARPRYAALTSTQGASLPSLERALDEFAAQMRLHMDVPLTFVRHEHADDAVAADHVPLLQNVSG